MKNSYWVLRHGRSKANEAGVIVSSLNNGVKVRPAFHPPSALPMITTTRACFYALHETLAEGILSWPVVYEIGVYLPADFGRARR
jgi:hypothetical protein